MISAGEAFLMDFHARDTGGSARVIARGRDERGMSSYQRLAAAIPLASPDVAVLDLACGDGYLLALLRERLGPNARLLGVDMSHAELAAARARLGTDVELRCERAQALTLASVSIDVVVSHMALMLMTPIDEVIRDMHRVLPPGGMVAAIVGSDRRAPGAWSEFIAIARELGAMPTMSLGDSRMRTADGIRSVFDANGKWSEVTIDDFELNCDGPWPLVEDHLFATYVPDLVEPALREALRRETVARIPALADAQGAIVCRLGMRMIQCRRVDACET